MLPHATRAGGRPRFPIRARVAAALAVAALVFGIIYVATDKGRIKIEVNDPNAVVFVDGKDVRIEGVGEPITLRAGEHSLTIKRGEVEVKAETFVVRRGDNEPLRITLEAPAREKLPEQPMPLAVASGDPPTLAKPVEAPKPSPPPAPKMEAVDTPPLKLAEAPKPSPPPAPKTEAVDTPPLKLDDALITNTLGMKLKLIPAGEFDMGSDATDPDAEGDEKFKGKKHHVRITEAFYLGTTEVTVGQFRQFVEKANYEGDPKSTRRSPGFPQTDEYPVVNVSHYDAVAFCDWLSREEGKTYRLPTEAEWEYGCRAGQATRYSSGDDEKSLAAVGHFKAGGTVAVGSLRPNAFGLYDMHGNVLEWCADWYDRDYYSKSPPTDPLNSSQAPRRVSRGGSWYTVGGYCRSAFRDSRDPSYRHYYLGFRVARVRSE